VQAIIELAHHMGFKVVAEGIENEDILNVLLKMDCDYGQGYYYEKPMTKENLITWLSNRGEHHEKE
jgi:EAL domain-containing protein (putative c-di-GMP-specific phosphodiesterase class I)